MEKAFAAIAAKAFLFLPLHGKAMRFEEQGVYVVVQKEFKKEHFKA
ncbi:hypothetical protein [Pontibacter ummariensis]|nr:hypothetical protein [Pontibacter ummariensis]